MFMGGYLGSGMPNEWWSNPAAAYVTSMDNGQDVTLTVAFDSSLWSNYNGINGSADTVEFEEALAGVTRIGLSFGSGYFFSDGFAFSHRRHCITPTLRVRNHRRYRQRARTLDLWFVSRHAGSRWALRRRKT